MQDADDAGRYDEIYYGFGRITKLLLDYDPVILEDAGNPLSDPNFKYGDDDDEIYYHDEDEEPRFDFETARALQRPIRPHVGACP